MIVKEQVMAALETMNSSDLLRVYNLILTIKSNTANRRPKPRGNAYLQTREALKNLKGSLADEIIRERDERVRI